MSAPHPEPKGYRAEPMWVKSNPLNNDYYVERMKGWEWYPAIAHIHRELTRLVPGYNIAQIKEKFGGLRYYIDLPEEIAFGEGDKLFLKSREEVIDQVRKLIAWGEAWVDGYEYRKHEEQERKEVEP